MSSEDRVVLNDRMHRSPIGTLNEDLDDGALIQDAVDGALDILNKEGLGLDHYSPSWSWRFWD